MDNEYSTMEQQLQMGSAVRQHMVPRLWEPHSEEQRDRDHDSRLNTRLRHAVPEQHEEQLPVSNAQNGYIGYGMASTQSLSSMASQGSRSASNLWSQSGSALSIRTSWNDERQSDRVASALRHPYDTQVAHVSWQAGYYEGLRAAEIRSRPATYYSSPLEGAHSFDGNFIYPIQGHLNLSPWGTGWSEDLHQQQQAESVTESDGVPGTPKRRKRKQNENRLKKRSEFFQRKKEEKQAAKAARSLTESPLQAHPNMVGSAQECSSISPVASSRGSWAESSSDTAHMRTYTARAAVFSSRSSTPNGLGGHRVLSTTPIRTNSLPVYQVERAKNAKNAVDLEHLKRSPIDSESGDRRRLSCEELGCPCRKLKRLEEFLKVRRPGQRPSPEDITCSIASRSNTHEKHSALWTNQWTVAENNLGQALTEEGNSQDSIPRLSESDARELNLDSLMDHINMPEQSAPQQLLEELESMEGSQLDLILDNLASSGPSQSRLSFFNIHREKSPTWPTCSRA